MIKHFLFAASATVALSACGAQIQSETYSTVSTSLDTYDVRTRTVARGDGSTYVQSAVQVYGYWYPCLIDSPGDCQKAARRGESAWGDRGFGER